ncbi:Acyl-homoserine-lactone synthase [Serratia entomophila]|jgi:N-acyl-L-homoserine lactone synthetase|uniref:Acyl-homoserine-lactone synthase n=1 Tax=Serratia entomophila TaxID=42906 RepID=A0ABY5CTL9_9GAMM|nr:acyl-homoserine-lactone synthase [Serratia entomophila]UIW18211.1 acyl-homoserine-lactone synthase [Serratia entomophila]USV01012.1 acyl-homoserine-lactone synthase [Serratia entomophila]CAI0923170.1 Acyl-homoserine-lactone synthase [Serratia entomophila]CAI0975794.1 Acyl-homoserine-lactone synthase [Serratia entomophila]CAI0986263.1 Acyl-homoserine-lactone synthase [Serratia entomophila]
MIELFDVNYNLLSDNRSRELFSLRKKTFKDRLDWIVSCENNMEFDEYDDRHTTYVFGTYKDQVICSLRFIETRNPNMISGGEFNAYFNNISLPEGNYVEASRLFIDKERVKALQLRRQPISAILFLSMINYARSSGYQGIYAIISHPMLVIFQRSGWEISVVETGCSEKNQNIYLVYMPIDDANQQRLIARIAQQTRLPDNPMSAWPLSFPVREQRADQLQLNA